MLEETAPERQSTVILDEVEVAAHRLVAEEHLGTGAGFAGNTRGG